MPSLKTFIFEHDTLKIEIKIRAYDYFIARSLLIDIGCNPTDYTLI